MQFAAGEVPHQPAINSAEGKLATLCAFARGIGNLFKSRTRVANKSEMLVFITPKVVAERGAAR